LRKKVIWWGMPYLDEGDEVAGCEGVQELHCFCHCVPEGDSESDDDSEQLEEPDPRDIAKPATPSPTTTPTPAKSPTPQPSRIA
jgi:hypothetical protein